MRLLSNLALTVLFLCSSAVFAGQASENLLQLPNPDQTNNAFYIAQGAGVAFNRSCSKTMVLPQSEGWLPDKYEIKHHTDAPVFLLELGGQHVAHRHWFAGYRYGIQYSYVGDSKVQGDILQFSDPEFNNYTYDINLMHHSIMFVNQLGVYRWTHVEFFIDAGVGVSLNKMVGYQERARSGITPRISPNFNKKLNSQFSYQVGCGFGYVLTPHNRLELAYRYSDNGRFTTGTGTETFSNDTLSCRQVSHQILVTLVSFFGADI